MNMEAFQEFMKIKHISKQGLDYPNEVYKTDLKRLRKKYKYFGIENDDKILAQEYRNNARQHREIELYIQIAQIYEISDKHKFLLLKTNNPKHNDVELWNNIRLPFPEIFIDVSFQSDEDGDSFRKISGILLREMKSVNIEKDKDGNLLPITLYGLAVYISGISKAGIPYLNTFKFPIHSSVGNVKDNFQTIYEDKKEANLIKKFIINFILFLKCREVTYIELKRSSKNREKRIKDGKIPLPNSKVIKLIGELKRYVNSLNDNDFKGKLSYMFKVSGHDRHYRHHRYKNMKGKVQWIESFKKGEGVEIDKVRRIIPDEDPNEIDYEDIKPLDKPLREQRNKK